MGLTRSDVLREEGRGLHPRRWLTQQQETRINSQIRAREVRLISHEGEQVGVVSIDEARRMAQDVDLDLVEVAPMAKPPVCKLMDYGKFKYEQQKAQRKGRKKSHTAELKRLRMRPKIDRHDIDTKLRKARQFLAEGDKVQVHMRFRGREMAHIEIGQQRLLEFAKELAEIAKVERAPSREGREMTMMLTPRSNAAEVYAAYKEALRNAKAGKKGKSPVTEPEEEPEDEDLLDDDEEQDLDDDEEQGLDD
ncbi:MAG: translation initiation factor IF-3, partial [Planctomycetota bacterium]